MPQEVSRIEGERIVRDAARLLSGEAPRGEVLHPEQVAGLLIHHNLGALGSYLAGRQTYWRHALAGEPLRLLDQTVLHAKIRRHMVIVALADALELLHDFKPVLFKGLAVAELYPVPHLRDPGDLDILLSAGSFTDAAARLTEAGWRLQPTIHRDRPVAVAQRYGFAQVFRHPVRPVVLDLHRDPIDRTEAFWINPADLLTTTRRLDLAEGVHLSTLTPARHLALIALHSVRHGSYRLLWSYDVHRACLGWRDAIDPDDFAAFCSRWRITCAVHVGLEVARQLFGTPWHPLESKPTAKAVVRAAARRGPYVIARGHLTRRGGWRRIGAMLDLLEHPADRARYLLRTLFPPRDLFATVYRGRPGWWEYWVGRLRAASQAAVGKQT